MIEMGLKEIGEVSCLFIEIRGIQAPGYQTKIVMINYEICDLFCHLLLCSHVHITIWFCITVSASFAFKCVKPTVTWRL